MCSRVAQALCTTGIAAFLAAGCRSPSESGVGRAAELLEARIPAAVAPGTAFEMVAYFGRGACDAAQPEVHLQSASARIGMRLRPVAIAARGPAAVAHVFVKSGDAVNSRAEFNSSLPPLAQPARVEEFVF